jgi:hypothetical protein
MKNKSVCLKFFAIILSVYFFKGFSAALDDDLAAFREARFTIQPLGALEESENPFHRKLVEFYERSGDFAGRVFAVTDHAKAPGKTEVNYAPPRTKAGGTEDLTPLDTIVLSRYNGAVGSSNLAGILTSWIRTGFSSHAVVTGKGTIIYWVDPTQCKGQMAGKWNACSVEILVATDAGHCLAPSQFDSLASIVGFSNAFANAKKEQIRHMLSHGEACGSQTEGTISNLDEVRGNLGLTNANKGHDQAPLA